MTDAPFLDVWFSAVMTITHRTYFTIHFKMVRQIDGLIYKYLNFTLHITVLLGINKIYFPHL